MKHEIVLPWPASGLSPNARVHFMKLANLKRAYRQECGYLALKQLGKHAMTMPQGLTVTLEFRPPSARKYDLDNCLSRMKAGLDGLADAIQVDDSKWDLILKRGSPTKGGEVHISIEEKKDENILQNA